MRNFNIIGYVLDEHKIAIPVFDAEQWARGFQMENRRVDLTHVGNCRVSTVFLGLDHNFSDDPDADPILFETMVFIDDDFSHEMEIMERYSTWAEAQAGHNDIVRTLTAIDFEAHRVTMNYLHELREVARQHQDKE